MSDHNERACTLCGSLLHHEDDCLSKQAFATLRQQLATSQLHAKGWREALGVNQPWNAIHVLRRLAEATRHLLDDHDCDTHGHESARVCEQLADKYASALELALSSHPSTESLDAYVRERVEERRNALLSWFTWLVGGWNATAGAHPGRLCFEDGYNDDEAVARGLIKAVTNDAMTSRAETAERERNAAITELATWSGKAGTAVAELAALKAEVETLRREIQGKRDDAKAYSDAAKVQRLAKEEARTTVAAEQAIREKLVGVCEYVLRDGNDPEGDWGDIASKLQTILALATTPTEALHARLLEVAERAHKEAWLCYDGNLPEEAESAWLASAIRAELAGKETV